MVQNKVLQLLVFQSNVITGTKCDNSTCLRKLQTFQRKRKYLFELLTTSSNLHSLSPLMQIYNQHLHSLSNFIPQLTPFLSKVYLFSMKGEYSWSNENISSNAQRQQEVACKVDCPRQLKPQVKSVLTKLQLLSKEVHIFEPNIEQITICISEQVAVISDEI